MPAGGWGHCADPAHRRVSRWQHAAMARLIPADPTFATHSEKIACDAVVAALGPDDVVLANFRLVDATKDHEADLVVLMPEVGILVLEVKGGRVWRDEGGWRLAREGREVAIDPVTQAHDAAYAIRGYVERDPRWLSNSAGVVRAAWGWGVVLPFSSHPEQDLPEAPRWSVHDRDDIGAGPTTLGERLRAHATLSRRGRAVPSVADVEAIVDIVTGRPVIAPATDPEGEALDRAGHADRLTQEQAMLLRVTRLLSRVEIRGGAGSGKTVLALQQAKELGRGSAERPAQRVALLCYSIGLAEYLKRQVESWPRRHRPAFVGTFAELGLGWGAPDGDRTDSDFWENRLPSLMTELAAQLPDGKRFDSVVVDEAQDFADGWWEPLLGALRDEEGGGVYVFSDENQRLFDRFGRPPVTLVPLVLDHNLRNTRQIHDAFASLTPTRMQPRGGDGPEVRFVAATSEDALSAADDAVDALLEEGWAPGSVALLTTGHRHPEQTAQVDRHGHVGYWRTFWDGEDVFYGHVLGAKGLERRAVVLCLNERPGLDRARERLYVGMSRATDMLVVVGDPGFVREVGGPGVASALQP